MSFLRKKYVYPIDINDKYFWVTNKGVVYISEKGCVRLEQEKQDVFRELYVGKWEVVTQHFDKKQPCQIQLFLDPSKIAVPKKFKLRYYTDLSYDFTGTEKLRLDVTKLNDDANSIVVLTEKELTSFVRSLRKIFKRL